MMRRRLVLPSVPQSVPHAVRFVEAMATEQGLANEMVDRLLLATSEAVSNGIVHGNRYDPLKHVRVDWESEDNLARLIVEDEGVGLSRQRAVSPDLPDDAMQTSGRGLYIISVLAEHLQVEGCRVTMIFEPRPEERP